MEDSSSGREALQRLVEHFGRSLPALKSSSYNETQVRREFIDPLFEALGWDVDNKQGYAEAYKDVIHEDAIKIGGYTKAPDYCFRIGGSRKFFVEAKKPSVNIKDDPEPAYQLRRYAWSAKLPLSILTDFEEFAVYDCRFKPAHTDGASAGRVQFFTYEDYLGKWDEIASVFSRDAVLKGSFDRYAESNKAKRGTAEVDAAFLKEIEGWRDALAHNLALRNPNLTTRELNFAVQATLDRIIFLRICEDRGAENYGRLMALQNGPDVYKRLMGLFREADERYNSGLFHFEQERGRQEAPDSLTPSLSIDDKVLKDILKNLYYPESPYEFSVLPADILGQVYEQFLGKVIRLTAGHQAKVEDKPEVKKAGGVYYTPTYIVDYIVKNTVGKMLEGKTPAQVGGRRGGALSPPARTIAPGGHGDPPLRILDPACGSGSFLLGAYQYLLTWYRDRYVEDGPAKWAKGKEPRIYQGAGGEWKLTTAERKRILLNHIYGVDIDSQAVEVTKLSLLLKVLEGETQESINSQLKLFHERALPDLANNIKCGNSLIGSDFYKGKQPDLFNEEETTRVNAFDWEDEFPEVFRVREKPVGKGNGKAFTTEDTKDTEKEDSHGEEERTGGFDVVIGNPPYLFGEYHDPITKHHLKQTYKLAREQYDTYSLFLEKGLALTRVAGRFSMIVPDSLLARDLASDCRALLLKEGLERVYHCGAVFQAAVSAAVVVCCRGSQPSLIASDIRDGDRALTEHYCSRGRFVLAQGRRLLMHSSDVEALVVEKMLRANGVLGQAIVVSRGEEIGKRDSHSMGFPLLAGEDVSRYFTSAPSRFIGTIRKSSSNYASPKIIVVKTGAKVVASLDERSLTTIQSIYNLHMSESDIDPKYVLGILNSRAVAYYVRRTFTDYKLLFPQLNQTTLEGIPIHLPDLSLNADKSSHDRMVSLVDQMLSLHKRLQAARTEQDKTPLQRQIAATDKEIDRLVYDLYGLTEDEIRIVEGT
jgi:hypothetical protein